MGQAERMMEAWLRHRRVLEELLKPIGDEHVDFKPWDGAMSLGELALHVVQWNDVFVNLVKTGEFAEPNAARYRTMADVRDVVRELTEKTKATYASVTDEELKAERVFGLSGMRADGQTFLTMMYDHEVHHKGQLFVYARMVGVKEVPFFRDNK